MLCDGSGCGPSACPRFVRGRVTTPPGASHSAGAEVAGRYGLGWARLLEVMHRGRLSIQRSRVQVPSSPPFFPHGYDARLDGTLRRGARDSPISLRDTHGDRGPDRRHVAPRRLRAEVVAGPLHRRPQIRVASLARPGGNITGSTFFVPAHGKAA